MELIATLAANEITDIEVIINITISIFSGIECLIAFMMFILDQLWRLRYKVYLVLIHNC